MNFKSDLWLAIERMKELENKIKKLEQELSAARECPECGLPLFCINEACANQA